MEFCPVCMLRKGLAGSVESGESSFEEAVRPTPDHPPKRFEHYDACWQFFKQLRSKSLRSRKRAVIILDNAKYHHALLHKAWREEVMPGFALDFLPPYSPELNPIERVWKLTRRLCLHNVYFPKLDQVCATAEQQFNQWSAGSSLLKKLCAIT